MRHLVVTAALTLALPPLQAQQANDSVFALRSCESRVPVVGQARGDGIVAAMMSLDGRIDTATTRVLQVEQASVAGYRSAAARLLSTCRYRVTGNRNKVPFPVVIALSFGRNEHLVASAEQVPVLDAGIEPGPVLIPTQALPLDASDRRIEERPRVLPGCAAIDAPLRTRMNYYSMEDAMAHLNAQIASQRGNASVEFEVARDGSVVDSSVVLVSYEDPNFADRFVAGLRKCRFTPARIGGVPVPFKMVFGRASGGPP